LVEQIGYEIRAAYEYMHSYPIAVPVLSMRGLPSPMIHTSTARACSALHG